MFSGKDIALIGNAKSLLNKRYGTLIDSHEMVVRMNRIPTTEEKGALGWRTDVYVYSHPSLYDDEGIDVHDFCIDGYEASLRPSSGMRMVYHILHHTNYKSLTLYGFDFMNSVSLTTPNRKDNPHDFTVESALIKSYAEYGVLNLCQ